MKFYNFAMISIILAFIFELAGIPVAAGLLSYVGLSTVGLTIKSAALYTGIFIGAGILVGAVAGITIGTLTKSAPENYIVLGFLITSGTFFLTTSYGIVNAAWTMMPLGSPFVWISYLTTLVMGALAVGFIITIPTETFRGGS